MRAMTKKLRTTQPHAHTPLSRLYSSSDAAHRASLAVHALESRLALARQALAEAEAEKWARVKEAYEERAALSRQDRAQVLRLEIYRRSNVSGEPWEEVRKELGALTGEQ